MEDNNSPSLPPLLLASLKASDSSAFSSTNPSRAVRSKASFRKPPISAAEAWRYTSFRSSSWQTRLWRLRRAASRRCSTAAHRVRTGSSTSESRISSGGHRSDDPSPPSSSWLPAAEPCAGRLRRHPRSPPKRAALRSAADPSAGSESSGRAQRIEFGLSGPSSPRNRQRNSTIASVAAAIFSTPPALPEAPATA